MKSTTAATSTISATNMKLGCPEESYTMIKTLKSTNGCLDHWCCFIWYTQGSRAKHTYTYFQGCLKQENPDTTFFCMVQIFFFFFLKSNERKILLSYIYFLCMYIFSIQDTVVFLLPVITFSSLNLVLLRHLQTRSTIGAILEDGHVYILRDRLIDSPALESGFESH